MKEFKTIMSSQILVIIFLGGIAFGSLLGHPVYHTKIVRILPEQIYPEYIMKHAMRWHGNITVAKKEEDGNWIGIRKNGEPFKLFKQEVENE